MTTLCNACEHPECSGKHPAGFAKTRTHVRGLLDNGWSQAQIAKQLRLPRALVAALTAPDAEQPLCASCGAMFYPARTGRHKQRFCSPKCWHAFLRGQKGV